MQPNSKLSTKHQSPANHNSWIVLKFGGSSVGDAKHWQTIKTQVTGCLANGFRPLLVLSALKNVSNLLEALLHQALAGVYPTPITHLREMHTNFAAQLGLELSKQLAPWFEQLEKDCTQIYQSQQISPKLHAKVLSVGELLSSTIGFHYLNQQITHTTESTNTTHSIQLTDAKEDACYWLDVRELLKTDSEQARSMDLWHHFTSATCDYQNNRDTLDFISKTHAKVIVTQGFIAADQNGETVLLGREGSDTSATYLGALLNAKMIQIWTDVPGVFSCNPQQNCHAKQLPHLNYQDAIQMAQLGAKVLHPRAIQPAYDKIIPVIVKSTHLPQEAGTRIDVQPALSPIIKAITEETKVIAIHLATGQVSKNPGSISPPQLMTQQQAIEQVILPIGYDGLLTEVKQSDDSWKQIMLFRYTNSDQAEPALTTINDKILAANLNAKAQNCLSLLSLIGNANDEAWQDEVVEYCSQQVDLTLPKILTNLSRGRVSLIVDEKTIDIWRDRLHQRFIENCEQGFGKSWREFL